MSESKSLLEKRRERLREAAKQRTNKEKEQEARWKSKRDAVKKSHSSVYSLDKIEKKSNHKKTTQEQNGKKTKINLMDEIQSNQATSSQQEQMHEAAFEDDDKTQQTEDLSNLIGSSEDSDDEDAISASQQEAEDEKGMNFLQALVQASKDEREGDVKLESTKTKSIPTSKSSFVKKEIPSSSDRKTTSKTTVQMVSKKKPASTTRLQVKKEKLLGSSTLTVWKKYLF